MPFGLAAAVSAILAFTAVGVLAAVNPPSGNPRVDQAEAGFLAHIAQERASQSLGSVAEADDLVAIARHHSQDMAAAGYLWHDPNLGNEVQGWDYLGDNVGKGASVDSVDASFMGSPEHRSVILNPVYTQVGVGVAWSGDVLYVTEIFRRPDDARPAAPAPAPAPPPSPSLAPPAARAPTSSLRRQPRPPVTPAPPAAVAEAAPPAEATPAQTPAFDTVAVLVDGSPQRQVVTKVLGEQRAAVRFTLPVPHRRPVGAAVAALALLALAVGAHGLALRRLGWRSRHQNRPRPA